jgi:guanosine-3',5'-bis(diphosphate) 3'-pyrophosphohydrolase
LVAEFDTNLLLKALSFAAFKHRHQVRKGSPPIPYINHPIALADLLVRTGNIRDPEIIAAALLHDTVEDTVATFEEIEAEFGLVISQLVAELTDDKSLPKEKRKRFQVEHASTLSRRARISTMVSKLIPPRPW